MTAVPSDPRSVQHSAPTGYAEYRRASLTIGGRP